MDLAELDKSLIDGTFKGIPPAERPFALGELGARGWNLLRREVAFPAAVLRDDLLAHNSQWMRRFLALSGAQLCPHGKTTMSPQLFARQMADGAWGITLATIQQVCYARRFGVPRILLANQLVDPRGVEFIAGELTRDPRFGFLCLVDSLEGVELLERELARLAPARRLDVLVEVGEPGRRTGCRTVDEALAVARRASQSRWLALRGVEGFEGVISDPDPAHAATLVAAFLRRMLDVARGAAGEGLFAPGPVILTAGGSVFFDLAAGALALSGLTEQVVTLIRSGCYLTHDSAILDRLYQDLLRRSPAARALGPGLQPALEVWSYVQSRPEPTRVVLAFGKRDASHDADLPIPTAWHRAGTTAPARLLGHRVVSLNDQHSLLDVPVDSPLAVGDLVACGISHPCTTFDRWSLLLLVNERYDVVGGVRTGF